MVAAGGTLSHVHLGHVVITYRRFQVRPPDLPFEDGHLRLLFIRSLVDAFHPDGPCLVPPMDELVDALATRRATGAVSYRDDALGDQAEPVISALTTIATLDGIDPKARVRLSAAVAAVGDATARRSPASP